MASKTIHMAIAKKYCELHPEENYKDFLIGSNLPDITENKNQTHFGTIAPCSTYWEYAKNKVDLKRVVENINLENSLNRGVFMHLVCDYVFFNDGKLFIDPKSLSTKKASELREVCLSDFDNLTGRIVDKYKIDLNEMPEYLRKFLGKDFSQHD